jgi:hypothetical protein
MVAARVAQLFPADVHSLVLLDPVCLMTCFPQLLANFIYRPLRLPPAPGAGGALAALVDFGFDAARLLCARDPAVAATFCRHLHWAELMLWPEDLPRGRRSRTLIALSALDDLVPCALVRRQFAGSRATVVENAALPHGGFLLDARWMAHLVGCVRDLVAGSGTEEGDAGAEDVGDAAAALSAAPKARWGGGDARGEGLASI